MIYSLMQLNVIHQCTNNAWENFSRNQEQCGIWSRKENSIIELLVKSDDWCLGSRCPFSNSKLDFVSSLPSLRLFRSQRTGISTWVAALGAWRTRCADKQVIFLPSGLRSASQLPAIDEERRGIFTRRGRGDEKLIPSLTRSVGGRPTAGII